MLTIITIAITITTTIIKLSLIIPVSTPVFTAMLNAWFYACPLLSPERNKTVKIETSPKELVF
jgi:hypothetical protein